MSNQKNQSSSIIERWIINSCLGSHHICPKIWKNKFIEHEIHCKCNCHNNKNNDDINTDPEFCYSTDATKDKSKAKVLASEKKRGL
jgi:hypothetical protein